MEIREALLLLDVTDDDHWTSEGLPSLVQVSFLMERQVTREEVTSADPSFHRLVPAESEIAEADAVITKAQRAKQEAQKKRDAVVVAQEAKALSASEHFAIENRRYLESQIRQRQERAMNPPLVPASVKSVLDKSFEKGSRTRPRTERPA